MPFAGLDDPTRFIRSDGDPVTIEPGLYRIEPAGDERVALIADDGTVTLLNAESGGHPLELEHPIAVEFEVSKDDRRVALLLPGGRALITSSANVEGQGSSRQQVFTLPGFAAALLRQSPQQVLSQADYWRAFHRLSFATIEPDRSPAPFAPQTFPPNWVRTTVVTCYVAPKGSYGLGGPGTASGIPPFPPGTDVRRGPYPGYLVSMTPVRVTSPVSVKGQPVELRVVAHVATIGLTEILSMTWEDVYRIVPAADGPVDFPGVIVATGRVPSGSPPPGVSYTAQVQARLTSSTGFGVPVTFDVYVQGNWVGSRRMGYYASYPGGPPPALADK